ncbi:hypothetical protein COU54_05025 [Candidatus Pacearchaeota archaeon CG10_big_fil_rev_8_21_14_0_10_31_24]|nr:MAG: hypothetical protein COU54_05025 [Candidatus Pacearchaeota archaeon CG10_big_fil_rev_8_21_14_0_10_31_24]
MKTEIIPTVFAYDKKEFDERYNILIKISRKLQIDFMDGKLVSSSGVKLKEIEGLHKGIFFEAHLMVRNPEKWIGECKKKGFKKILFHYESSKNLMKLQRVVEYTHRNKMQAFITFNPETKIDKIVDCVSFLKNLEGVMLMGVHPGKEHQSLDKNIFSRLKELRKKFPKITLQVDGGTNDKNVSGIAKAGANIINTGSFVASAENPKNALNILKENIK